ncbi:Helitron helicase-like protein [Phytophthora palmivora]|uniref:Helitron helicase-like protein n=1 Tax=Phytophthora palmivora TaxID=4796 RepID=A0A2P4XGL6_9STRA|nr:Helitron helicase-like protein [Phytophthora palmivora]
MNDEQYQVIRISNSLSRAVARAEMNDEQRGMIQNRDAVARATSRGEMTDEQHRVIQGHEAIARAFQRSSLSQEHRQEIQECDTNARAALRRSRQYKKGYDNHEDFDSMSVRGNDTLNQCHYVSQFIRGCSGDERTCADCGARRFPAETKNCCCMGGKFRLPPPREAPDKPRLLFKNPVFMQSIRAYNNDFAFTSMRASRSEPLQVDESVTRRGVYNFRVMGTGTSSPAPPGERQSRVASRIRMTDGLSVEILNDIDEVMEQHNPYAQQFLHAREIMIGRSRPAL